MRHLTVRLRELKDHTGLSLTDLARRTPASRSAWSRYLNGQVLPPWKVASALGQLADTNQTELKTLWRLADHAYRQRPVHTGTDEQVQPAPSGKSAPADDHQGIPHRSDDQTVPSPHVRERPAAQRWTVLGMLHAVIPTLLAIGALTIALTGWRADPSARTSPHPTPTPSSDPASSSPLPSATPTPATRPRSHDRTPVITKPRTKPKSPKKSSSPSPSVERSGGPHPDPDAGGGLPPTHATSPPQSRDR
ncbi:helix-turn-helix transcriptional regulator [Actinomadura fulvescens]